MAFVDLSRCFRDLTEAELEEPELLASLNEREFLTPAGWSEILQHPRVLLLAEAGSGKTVEMREQAKRLFGEGKAAFFVALEALDREKLTELLSPAEERAFRAWKANDYSTAWFFLDAVDELKLTQGKLDRALGRMAKATDGLLHRMHVVISCRPHDWRPLLDMATMQARLPITPGKPSTTPSSDEVFLAALRKQENGRDPEAVKSAEVERPRTVVLLPLSERQIETFAQSLGVKDATAFISEIRKQNAWAFARRPLDLSELAATWIARGRLGTRAEQHEANVTAKLRDDPDRPDRGVLSDARARLGAERLALALALTHTRTIRSPEQPLDAERAEGVLDPSLILIDWSELERQALLRRAMFDPATYGRVRFHHRSVQEYLAARRLNALRTKGMSTKALFRLLFAECYDVPVVIPSMRAIAAWLALWNEDVRRNLMAREPEVLLSMGDPETLPMSARARLVCAFAGAYGEGGWRGLDIPHDEIRRLAHPELAGVVRELWGGGPPNDDVRELLLEMIWQGAIKGCADIAEGAAYVTGLPEDQRIIAVRAIVACDRVETARAIAESMMSEPAKWPERVIHNLANDLFPSVLTIAELIALIERTHEPKGTVLGFSWALRRITDAVDPWSDTGVELRNALADLIWRGRYEKQEVYQLKGRFDHVASALALLCDRQLSVVTAQRDECLIRACVIANRFGDDETGAADVVPKLKRHFGENVELREAAFWCELALMNEVVPTKDGVERLFRAEHDSIVEYLKEGDRPWLERVLRDTSSPDRRVVALHALIPSWVRRGRIGAELDVLRGTVKDDVGLTEELIKRAAPVEPNAQLEKFERDQRRRQYVREGRERRRLTDWTKWRDKLIADPDAAFTPGNVPVTLRNLHQWLIARAGARNRHNVWDADALHQAFGRDIAGRASEAFRALWRSEAPTVPSQRPAEERNSIPWSWIHGLCGLAAEATSSGWAAHLTPGEARIAAAYATVEINGFPAWLKDLAAAHPVEVDAVLGGELAAELAGGVEDSYLPTLQDVAYADFDVKRLFSPRLFRSLTAWPAMFPNDEGGRRWAHHLDHVVRILNETSEGRDRTFIATECEKRFAADPAGPLAQAWLRGLFRFDPERGAEALEGALAARDEPEQAAYAVTMFAGLFGDRDGDLFDFTNSAKRATVVGRLVHCAYRYVRHENDQKHEGVYEPNTRDQAETARSFLLSALLDTPGPEAHRVLLDLTVDPRFAYFSDRLRLLARQRAASDAEGEPLRPADIAAMDESYEAPPHDRDGLFDVTMDRLDDLEHDIAHDDFTDRLTLRTIEHEIEMQRTLARRLRDMARGAYVVMREDEVADQKQTDIRLAAVRGEQKAVIEVKIADKRWSLKDFERALRDQLVGQYLRHESCKAGCLLLTYNGTRSYWVHPDTGARLGFHEAINYLARIAEQVERELAHGVRLAVHGLDLTDPPLAPAHR